MTSESDQSYKSLPDFDSKMENWPIFKLKFRLFLETRDRDLRYVIDREDDDASADDDLEEKTLKKEQKKNRAKDDAKVRSYLLNKIGSDIIYLVAELPTAYAMVERLGKQFESTTLQSTIMKLDRLLDIEYRPGSDITAHIAKIAAIINQLRAAGEIDWDKLYTVVLLRSLPRVPEWNGIVQALKTHDDTTITKEKVVGMITERANELTAPRTAQEKQDRSGNSKNAFQTAISKQKHSGSKFTGTCNNCGKIGHKQRDCWAKGGGAEGAGPSQQHRKGANATKESRNDKHFAFLALSEGKCSDKWIIDSGSTQHYTHCRDLFSNFEAVDDELTVANGISEPIKGVGTVRMITTGDTVPGNEITLNRVYYAPGLKANLVSLPQLDRTAGLRSYTADGKTVFTTKQRVKVMTATLSDYYTLDAVAMDAKHAANATAELWHARMGCLGRDSLERLRKEGMVKGFSFKGDWNGACEHCPVGKAVRMPFRTSENPRARHPLDLIHMDILVINEESRKEEKYALVIIDDHSECKFVFPLKGKSGQCILAEFRPWLGWAERSSDRKLKAVRSDNAKEFKHGAFADYLNELHVERQYSIRYEHEQNGKIERTIRTLMDKARCMLMRSTFPKRFWADALLSAAFVANRSPVKGLDVTPIEAFTGVQPSLAKIRVFGSRGWAKIPPEHTAGRHKLDARAIRCRLLRYIQGGHAYLVIDEHGKTFETVNVVFDEHQLEGEWPEEQQTTFDADFEDESLQEEEEITESHSEAAEAQSVESSDEMNDQDSEGELSDAPNVQRTPERRPIVDHAPPAPRRISTRARQPPRQYWKTAAERRNHNQSDVHMVYLTYEEAMSGPDREKWEAAMDKEIEQLERYKVFDLVELPPGKKALGGKWVLGRKKDDNGLDGAYKARWVGKGFNQTEGVDYFETFSPVARQTSLRVVLALAEQYELDIRQMDVTAAYLNGEIEEELYMVQPTGYEVGSLVARVLKGLYGFKQAGRSWNRKLDKTLTNAGFTRSQWDRCIYYKSSIGNRAFVIVLVYVDDLLAVASKESHAEIENVVQILLNEFEIKDLGWVKRYLGAVVKRDDEQLFIGHQDLTHDILERFQMLQCKGNATPMEQNVAAESLRAGETATNHPYRSVVGSCMHLATTTRPDIAFSVGMLSRYLENPSERHWQMAMRLLRYLQQTKRWGLTFRKSDIFTLTGWADADWGADLDTRRSVGGFAIFLGNNLVSWKSKRQATVATSSTAAELEALYVGVLDGIWIKGLLNELGLMLEGPMEWFQDNQSAIKTVESEKHSERTKHLQIKVQFLREKLEQQEIKLTYKETASMVADILTKPLGKNKFERFRMSLGMSERDQH